MPGNPRDGSVVMVAKAGAERTAYSVNHGAKLQTRFVIKDEAAADD